MKKIPCILAIVFFIVGLITINDYGINWDSPEHFMRGNAILHYFLTGKKTFDISAPSSPILIKPGEFISRYSPSASERSDQKPDLPVRPLLRKEYESVLKESTKRFSFYRNNQYDMNLFLKEGVTGHLALADVFSALGNAIFSQLLGRVGDLASYQLFGLCIGALGVYIVSRFAFDLTGSRLASCVAGIALALHPSFFSHVHLNLKDPIVAVMYAGTIWSFWHWVRENSKKWGVLVAVFFTIALGVKWTIAFIPVILVPWLIVIRKTTQFRRWFVPMRLLVFACVACAICVAILFAVSPFLWHDTAGQLSNLFSFYRELGVSSEKVGFNSLPWYLFVGTTPEGILVFSLIAFFALSKSQLLLFFLWIFVPLFRLSLPGARFYGGINQFMEVLPALAILAGVGADYLVRISRGVIRKIIVFIIFILFILLIIPLIRLHPNENLYFNNLVGGIAGARDRKLFDWFTNYGNLYKQAADWLNVHAQKDANIAHLDGPTFALSPLMVRPDISISPYHFSGFDAGGEYIVQVPDILGSYTFVARYTKKMLKPVHEIRVGGVTVLEIYKNDPKYWRRTIAEEKIENPPGAPGESVNGPYWEIDLGKHVNVTRIVLSNIPAKCQKINSHFIDETIGFFDEPQAPINKKAVYTIQEHRLRSADLLEYDFSGEPGRYVRIYIESAMSCFLGARVAWVSYISNNF